MLPTFLMSFFTGKFPPPSNMNQTARKWREVAPRRNWQLFRFKFARGLVCKYILTQKNTQTTNSQGFTHNAALFMMAKNRETTLFTKETNMTNMKDEN